ncbi:hypothetical protein VFPFJ_08820 [Purpureocillium lilacinum]|uniref:Uncharacterized protein n=1 Tax=Purpureocillium lilacinum TaxID=33203 RepID=A0A179GYF9_PURLI|nr:hypothetical protein VFPFJ_08820 [Purpureocillium lilacinum]OAQ74905.1 hypothetical protein VFPBJ_10200 [Purpureocillium lilacinum]OAQ83017.1 hypothetical protein VFPFJ_08820 [Purpureocillium lilacinum]
MANCCCLAHCCLGRSSRTAPFNEMPPPTPLPDRLRDAADGEARIAPSEPTLPAVECCKDARNSVSVEQQSHKGQFSSRRILSRSANGCIASRALALLVWRELSKGVMSLRARHWT